jgi:drug/metabolite transporter (DMT)-like permease
MKSRDLAIYIFLSLAWGLSFLVVLHLVLAFGWVGAVAFRALTAAVTLFVLAAVGRRKLDFSAGWKPFAIVGATTVAGQLLGLSYATPLIGTAMAAIIVISIPLFSMLISHVWGLERIGLNGLIGLLLGGVGMVLLVGFPAVPVTPSFILGCLAMLAACFSAAFGSNYASHKLASTGSWEISAGAFLAGGIMCLPFLFAVPVPDLPGLADIVYLAIAGCVMSAMTYVLYFRLVASIGSTKAVSVEFVVTIVAVIVGAIVLHEPLSVLQGFGALIIVTGCALVLGLFPWQRNKVAEVPLPHVDGTP